MTKENLIWLTKEIYRLTLLFPKKEPLRYKMREIADDILSDYKRNKGLSLVGLTEAMPKLTGGDSLQIFEDLEVLDGFFEVAKEQNWVNPDEILKLQDNYSKIKQEFKTETDLEMTLTLPLDASTTSPKEAEENSLISERQEKILAFLKEQGQAQVWQIKQVLPEVTKRTLRRDFESLLKKGLVERAGERNNTFYQLKIT